MNPDTAPDVTARDDDAGKDPLAFAKNISTNISKLQAEAEAKAEGHGPALLTPEEERTAPVFTIGGEEYTIPSLLDWTIEQDETIAKLLPELMPLVEEAMDLFSRNAKIELYNEYKAAAEADYKQRILDEAMTAAADGREPTEVAPPTLPEEPKAIDGEELKELLMTVVRVVTEKKLHRKLLAAAYVPVGTTYDPTRTEEIEAKMGVATNLHLLQAVGRFFTIGNG